MAEFLYKGVVDWFLAQRSQNTITTGDRMPSLRALSKQLGLSLNTVIHGYDILSQEGWIESRPKSGYFVCHRGGAKAALLLAGDEWRELANKGAQSAWASLAHHAALVDHSDSALTSATFHDKTNVPVLGKGHLAVRESVCDYLKNVGIKAHAAQLWLGQSPLAMFSQSVQTLTLRGDTVLVLTPCDPRITATLQGLGRQVITLGAGERGVDLDLVVRALQDKPVQLIVLPGQFSFPAGQLISNLSLRRWLAIIEDARLPVIEWDLCSHLAYRETSMMTYKSLDSSDLIVYIGGIEAKGVGRSVSWCLPGQYHQVLEGAFLAVDMALSDAQQEALNEALQPHGKHSITRRARHLWANSERIKSDLEAKLGEQVNFATSKGGIALWMRLSQPLSDDHATALFARFRHDIVPGTLVSQEADADHWMAVNVTVDDIASLGDALAMYFGNGLKATLVVDDSKDNKHRKQKTTAVNVIVEPTDKPLKKTHDHTTSEPLYNPMLDLINHDFG
ncbi:GntR family transcriptional regulator [Marinomonas sp. IMCC 4694]|uniref:GntR family transcriptional regulator n=1 Tax=Marinomonas sp. IMCC 4694 TaxID=2605432 RepID=UPI0011E6D483|nr:GntR family transcriptional regulator [Marinomonas sp. IMCC 4694]TYL49303.1 GntR family transcriptional regulator [Marinomonas sp. IMCC 4694]